MALTILFFFRLSLQERVHSESSWTVFPMGQREELLSLQYNEVNGSLWCKCQAELFAAIIKNPKALVWGSSTETKCMHVVNPGHSGHPTPTLWPRDLRSKGTGIITELTLCVSRWEIKSFISDQESQVFCPHSCNWLAKMWHRTSDSSQFATFYKIALVIIQS